MLFTLQFGPWNAKESRKIININLNSDNPQNLSDSSLSHASIILSTEFRENRCTTFLAILLTDKQTDRQTNRQKPTNQQTENINLLAELIKCNC